MLQLRARKSSPRPSSSLEQDEEEEGASRKLPQFCVVCFSFLRNVFFTMVAFWFRYFLPSFRKSFFVVNGMEHSDL